MKRLFFTGLCAAALSGVLVVAQTRVEPPPNRYTPAQDVELGREAAAQARQEMPLMRDDAVTSYIDELGRRLVATIRSDLQQAAFEYSFDTVNIRDINAFALPGGPMFVNRGMIEAAETEGEVIGVMAHEVSHVILRHGTAQASKAGKYQAGQIAGAIFGAIIGGRAGDVIAQGTQFGLGAMFLKYGREYERQADIEGSHMMARAGYDPREMASMFKTIGKASGGRGGPEWLSSHPNPGNRAEYITKEARSLRVSGIPPDTSRFTRIKARLKSLPPAPTSEEVARRAKTRSESPGDSRPPASRVEPPSTRYRQVTAGNVFTVSVPSNWRDRQGSEAITFGPDGAFGTLRGQHVFTHGIEFGISRNEGHDLETATRELIDSLARGNPRMSAPGRLRRSQIGRRSGLTVTVENVSEASGESETVSISTTQLDRRELFYAIAVAPARQYDEYSRTFRRVIDSVQFLR
jgi:hypothetical protein